MAILNDAHKKAAKAALARLVVHHNMSASEAGWNVGAAVMELGLQIGDMSRVSALTAYAAGVERHAEKVSNRKWGTQYPPVVRDLADDIVGRVKAGVALPQ